MIIILIVIAMLIAYAAGYSLGMRTSDRRYEEIFKIKDRWIDVFRDELESARAAHKEITKKYHKALRRANEQYIEQVMAWRRSQTRKRG